MRDSSNLSPAVSVPAAPVAAVMASATGPVVPGSTMPGSVLSGSDADSRTARAVARGICRLFARNDIWCIPEMPLRSGRRADLMGIDAKGHVIIVEIKVSKADLLGDGKWTDYLDHCDRFFWGLHPALDRACMETEAFRPDACGLIVADGYDAEILRPAPTQALAPARRKVEVELLARAALRRHVIGADPQHGGWSGFSGALPGR